MTEANTSHIPPHSRAAQAFYLGMAQAVREANELFLPQVAEAFARRNLSDKFEQSFSQQIAFSKRLHQYVSGVPRMPVSHTASLFMAEYFACIAALNLYRLPKHLEQFKAELLSEQFLTYCTQEELEWMGIYDADILDFKQETGFEPGQWRTKLIRNYLGALRSKSSRDTDTIIAARLLLEGMGLSRARSTAVTPALVEHIAGLLEAPAGWLAHYLKFHQI